MTLQEASSQFLKAMTTPVAVTDEIRDFARELSPEAPVLVPVKAARDAQELMCFPNVARVIAEHGGEIEHGWNIYELPGVVLTAEFHANWRMPNGELLDITPKDEHTTLFVPDTQRRFEGTRISNRHRALMDAPVVRRWIAADMEVHRLVAVGPNEVTTYMVERMMKLAKLTRQVVRLYEQRSNTSKNPALGAKL